MLRPLTRLAFVLLIPTLLLQTRPAQAQTTGDLKDQRHLVEVGLYLGALLPWKRHDLFNDGASLHRRFDPAAADIGLRVGYLPLPWIGAELELGLMPTQTSNDRSALLYTARAHVIGQLPLFKRFAAFMVAGAGLLGVGSKPSGVGNDLDSDFYYGLGAKWYPKDWLAVRIDVRHNLSHHRDSGVAHHFEVLAGISYVFNWAKDSDKDGIADKRDRCPDQPGPAPDGCPAKEEPPKDSDGDGITDDQDKCPQKPENRNGYQDADGCPDQPPEMKRFTGAIRGVTFDTGKATIRNTSFKLLDEAADVLKKYKTVRLMISGHTDNVGDHDKNIALSQQRAEAVREYLIKKGIAADRLEVKGHGPDKPVTSNDTREGRAKNRRIEFKIVAQ